MTTPNIKFIINFVVDKEVYEKEFSDHRKASAHQMALLDNGIEATLKASKVA